MRANVQILNTFLFFLITNYFFSQSSVNWTNAPSDLTFAAGEVVPMQITYNTPDLDYICVWVREVNASNQTVTNYGAFNTCPLSGSTTDTHPNSGTINYNYTIPADVPESSSLPSGNYYKLIIFLWDDGSTSTNGNVDITIASTTNSALVTANLNTKHIVGGIETLERNKFISIHANQREAEWDGNNYIDNDDASNNISINLRDHFLNGYDVYMGRDTGGITFTLNNVDEDPTRSGYAKPFGTNSIDSRGATRNTNYANNTNWHVYESRNNLILGGQLNPFWTGTGQIATNSGWFLSDATATGEFMGRYYNEAHGTGGTNGEPYPKFVEIINEPAYERYGGPQNFTNSIQDIADFHKDASIAIKAQAPNAKVGGYTTAFPNFEKGDFQRWNNRWKLFMDTAGSNMDFWSIHLYDLASKGDGTIDLRSGSNIEATLDMMEQYSHMSFGTVKPFVISEFGAQMNGQRNQPWTPFRDWLWVKSTSAQLMSLLERPNNIDLALPFVVIKAIWGSTGDGNPYNNRLMRQENEPTTFIPGYAYNGKWVYTDIVKFYQLWSKVKGTRIDTTSDNLDIQVDAYVDQNKAYLILNNLNFESTNIDLNLYGLGSSSITSISKKHLYLDNTNPVLLEENISTNTNTLTIGAEATIILEYTFDTNLTIDETNEETKYYATTYLKPITANQSETFNINGVSTSTYGESVLRLGVGRPHANAVFPGSIKVNNVNISIPNNWRGYDQAERERFFGVLEIPIPFDLIQNNNTVEIVYPDSGGHISTVTMQIFNFSSDIRTLSTSRTSDITKPGLIIYPNPTEGTFNLRSSSHIKKVKIYNIKGIAVKELDFGFNMDISELPSGMYFIKTDNGYYSKILKK